MKAGFTLIETIFVILISSIISVSLYVSFTQISKSVYSIARIIDADSPLMPFYNQLDRDVTSIFAPSETLTAFGQKYLKQDNKDNKDNLEQEAKPKNEQQEKQQKQNSQKIIEDIFYVNIRNDGGILWSFITTGGISKLEKDGTLAPQSYVRRACYLLERDSVKPDLFRLVYRTEFKDLSLSEIEKKDFYPSYVIMQNIKTFSLEFTVFESVKVDEKSKDHVPSSPKSAELREWHEKDIFEKYKTLIPAYVKVSGSYTDIQNKVEYPFSFEFKVYAYREYKPESEKMIPAKEQLQESTEKSKVIFGKLSQFVEEKFGNLKTAKN